MKYAFIIASILLAGGFKYTEDIAQKMGEQLAQSVVRNINNKGELSALEFNDILYWNAKTIGNGKESYGIYTPQSHKDWKAEIAKKPSIVHVALKLHGNTAKVSFEKELTYLINNKAKEGFKRINPMHPSKIEKVDPFRGEETYTVRYNRQKVYYDSMMVVNRRDSLEWIANMNSFSLKSFYKKQKKMNSNYQKLISKMINFDRADYFSERILWEQSNTNKRLATDVHRQFKSWRIIDQMPTQSYNYGLWGNKQVWYIGDYPVDLLLFVARQNQDHPKWSNRKIWSEADKILNEIDALIK